MSRRSRFCHSHHEIRKCRGMGLTILPERDLRGILDDLLDNGRLSSKIRQHSPLPPDGDDPADFDSGTRELNDLVDVQELSEEIEAQRESLHHQQVEKEKQDEQVAFEERVQKAVAEQMSATQPKVE